MSHKKKKKNRKYIAKSNTFASFKHKKRYEEDIPLPVIWSAACSLCKR